MRTVRLSASRERAALQGLRRGHTRLASMNACAICRKSSHHAFLAQSSLMRVCVRRCRTAFRWRPRQLTTRMYQFSYSTTPTPGNILVTLRCSCSRIPRWPGITLKTAYFAARCLARTRGSQPDTRCEQRNHLQWSSVDKAVQFHRPLPLLQPPRRENVRFPCFGQRG
jgi:hypothetical protein